MDMFPHPHVSLVTGASTGIGAAVAVALASKGSLVAVHYHANASAAERVVGTILERGGKAMSFQADLSIEGSSDTLVEQVLEATGRVDVLVNNAGSIINRKKLLEISDTLWRDVLETNLSSVFRTCRAVAPVMIKQRSGVIINVSSVAARNGGSIGIIPYAASKAAVLCLTKGLAKELIGHGIRVNGVNPGVIDTPFHERFTSADQMKALVNAIPQGRCGIPEEIASVIVFLVSSESTHIVGETIEVNGGMLMD